MPGDLTQAGQPSATFTAASGNKTTSHEEAPHYEAEQEAPPTNPNGTVGSVAQDPPKPATDEGRALVHQEEPQKEQEPPQVKKTFQPSIPRTITAPTNEPLDPETANAIDNYLKGLRRKMAPQQTVVGVQDPRTLVQYDDSIFEDGEDVDYPVFIFKKPMVSKMMYSNLPW